MEYKRINKDQIEIIVGDTPIQDVLETLAQVSYESAKRIGMGKVAYDLIVSKVGASSERTDFSSFVKLENTSNEVLEMEYVDGISCQTYVTRTQDGKFIFDAGRFQEDRGSPKAFLDNVKSVLKEKAKMPKELSFAEKAELVLTEYKIDKDICLYAADSLLAKGPWKASSAATLYFAMGDIGKTLESIEISCHRNLDVLLEERTDSINRSMDWWRINNLKEGYLEVFKNEKHRDVLYHLLVSKDVLNPLKRKTFGDALSHGTSERKFIDKLRKSNLPEDIQKITKDFFSGPCSDNDSLAPAYFETPLMIVAASMPPFEEGWQKHAFDMNGIVDEFHKYFSDKK